MSFDTPDQNHEELSRALVSAMLASEEVRHAMEAILADQPIDEDTHMVLMLKIKSLAESFGMLEGDSTPADLSSAIESSIGSVKLGKVTRGDELGAGEKAFREYLDNRFDEKEWLKKNRLIL